MMMMIAERHRDDCRI